jgi:hypothetical protein
MPARTPKWRHEAVEWVRQRPNEDFTTDQLALDLGVEESSVAAFLSQWANDHCKQYAPLGLHYAATKTYNWQKNRQNKPAHGKRSKPISNGDVAQYYEFVGLTEEGVRICRGDDNKIYQVSPL